MHPLRKGKTMTETQKLRDQVESIAETPTETHKLKLELAKESLKAYPGLLSDYADKSYIFAFVDGYDQGHSLANEAAQKEIEELKVANASALNRKSYIEVLENENAALESQLTASNARCEELKAAVDRERKAHEANVTSMHGLIDKLRNEVKQWQKSCDIKTDTIKEIGEDLASSNARAARYREALLRLEVRICETQMLEQDLDAAKIIIKEALAYDSEKGE